MQTTRIDKTRYLYYNINANTYELFWVCLQSISFFFGGFMSESKGYIKIDRKIMENWLWSDSVFCKGAAWIDLLLNAHFQKGAFQSKKGRITYNRGDCTYSLSDLAKRWNWSRCKVRSFLGVLEEHNMIKRKMAKEKYSIITILNYDKYQGNNIKQKDSISEADEEERNLRFLLGDEYDEYMAKRKKKNG